MSTENIQISLTEKQLKTIISGLLFSASVNVVSNTHEEYLNDLFTLAKDLKKLDPKIKLDSIQFVKEDNYEDSLSLEVLKEFIDNMEIVTFEEV